MSDYTACFIGLIAFAVIGRVLWLALIHMENSAPEPGNRNPTREQMYHLAQADCALDDIMQHRGNPQNNWGEFTGHMSRAGYGPHASDYPPDIHRKVVKIITNDF